MKWIGILIVFSCCTAAGFSYSGSIVEKRRNCSLMIQYWKSFRQLLQTSRSSPLSLAMQLGESSAYSQFQFAADLKQAAVFKRSFKDALTYLFDREKCDYLFLAQFLSPLGETMGCFSLETEIQVLDTVLLRLEQELSFWAEKEERQAGLSRRLGLLCGILLVVVLL